MKLLSYIELMERFSAIVHNGDPVKDYQDAKFNNEKLQKVTRSGLNDREHAHYKGIKKAIKAAPWTEKSMKVIHTTLTDPRSQHLHQKGVHDYNDVDSVKDEHFHFNTKSFMSTSLLKHEDDLKNGRGLQTPGANGHRLVIHLPAKTKGLHVKTGGHYDYENEFLLSDDARIRVHNKPVQKHYFDNGRKVHFTEWQAHLEHDGLSKETS